MTSVDPPIRALILDLGNVLVFHDNDRLYRELAAACGCEPEAVLEALSNSGIGRQINTTDAPPAFVYETVAPAIGFRGSIDDFSAIWNGIFTPYEAMLPVVEALRGHVPLIVLSNTNALHIDYLRAVLPVLDAFDAVLASNEIGVAKPDAAAYETALVAARVAANEAAFFDDVPGHVEGARRVGIRGYVFTDVDAFIRDLRMLGL